MRKLKIHLEFWNAILAGTKKYEFRKWDKGILKEVVEFTSMDGKTTYGQALLNSIGTLSPKILKHKLHYSVPTKWYADLGYKKISISESEAQFILKNYLGKHDFLTYEISGVVPAKLPEVFNDTKS